MSDVEQTINSADAARGANGQLHLAAGEAVALRMWRDEEPDAAKGASVRPYETAGYVLSGRAELHLGERVISLEPGDSWVVPKGVSHTYRILETFSALEATSPPAQ